ncbi:MAG TPA: winged helix-turn-helix domain-containing protein [Steroidobacteraceae bacterium]|nr:winged helix-turn-helix domain-containing protein [Steroidobacteraceae bacterium]
MQASDSPAIRIGAWRVDPALDEISKDGNTVKLERRAMQLLLYLSKHADRVVSVEQLLDEVWAGVVVTPDSVYHAVAALRRLLGDDTKQPTYIANVPRRGYRLIAPVAPWIDSARLPLENPQRPAVEPARTILAVTKTGSSWRRFAIVASVALTLTLGYVLVDRFWLSKHPTAVEHPPTDASTVVADRSIAVLPFVDMSEKKDQEYFADGIADEVLNLLSKIPALKVIGRTSSFQFKGKNEDLRKIGAELGAAYVLEGSLRKSGDRMRVTAQLIASRDGGHAWADTYEAASSDVFGVQDQIAAAVVRALQVTIGADDLRSRPMKSAEAYELYLRGRHAYDRFDKAGFENAANYFRQALVLEPSSVRAAEWLALTLESSAEWGFVPPREGFESARAATLQALALDSRSALAHMNMCSIHTIYDWNWADAAGECQLALAIEPRNPLALATAGQALVATDQPDEGARLLSAALTLDPMVASTHVLLGNNRRTKGRLAESAAEFRKALDISPQYVGGHYYLALTLLAQGKLDTARSEMELEVADGGRDVGLAIIDYARGHKPQSDLELARVPDGWAYEIACAYAYRGEADRAIEWLDRAYNEKDVSLAFIKVEPLFGGIKTDSRYKTFLGRMNLPE